VDFALGTFHSDKQPENLCNPKPKAHMTKQLDSMCVPFWDFHLTHVCE